MLKRNGFYIKAMIGSDMNGESCVYFHWVRKKSGSTDRPLVEAEIRTLLQNIVGELNSRGIESPIAEVATIAERIVYGRR